MVPYPQMTGEVWKTMAALMPSEELPRRGGGNGGKREEDREEEEEGAGEKEEGSAAVWGAQLLFCNSALY